MPKYENVRAMTSLAVLTICSLFAPGLTRSICAEPLPASWLDLQPVDWLSTDTDTLEFEFDTLIRGQDEDGGADPSDPTNVTFHVMQEFE